MGEAVGPLQNHVSAIVDRRNPSLKYDFVSEFKSTPGVSQILEFLRTMVERF